MTMKIRLWMLVAPLALSVTLFAQPEPATTLFPIDCMATSLTAASDGAVWFICDFSPRVGRLVPATGTVTYMDLPWPSSFTTDSVLAGGDDGDVWYVRSDGGVFVLTASGETSHVATTAPSGSILRGPDGNFWLAETDVHRIARVTPNGTVTTFDLALDTYPTTLIIGPDGALWFDVNRHLNVPDAEPMIGRLTLDGDVSYVTLPLRTVPGWLVNGGDGFIYVPGETLGGANGCVVRNHTFRVAMNGTITNIGWFSPTTSGINDHPWTTLPCQISELTATGMKHYVHLDEMYQRLSVMTFRGAIWYSERRFTGGTDRNRIARFQVLDEPRPPHRRSVRSG